jgi:hypothetical protein
MWAGIVSAGPISARVEKIGFGSHERPFIFPDSILSGTAFDLHALCRNDHRQRFVRAGHEFIRDLNDRPRWWRAHASGEEEHQQESRELGCLGNGVLSLGGGLMPKRSARAWS